MINVVVVPETEDFEIHVSHGNQVWINGNLGIPKIDEYHPLKEFKLTEIKPGLLIEVEQ